MRNFESNVGLTFPICCRSRYHLSYKKMFSQVRESQKRQKTASGRKPPSCDLSYKQFRLVASESKVIV